MISHEVMVCHEAAELLFESLAGMLHDWRLHSVATEEGRVRRTCSSRWEGVRMEEDGKLRWREHQLSATRRRIPTAQCVTTTTHLPLLMLGCCAGKDLLGHIFSTLPATSTDHDSSCHLTPPIEL